MGDYTIHKNSDFISLNKPFSVMACMFKSYVLVEGYLLLPQIIFLLTQ